MSKNRYIRTEKFHILPIYGVTPDDLKQSAKEYSKDRENMPYTSRLNFLAKTYGVKGGFSGYSEEFKTKLTPFMVKNGLLQKHDLINVSDIICLNVEKVANRLFVSGRPLPEKIFTGWNFDFTPYEDGFHKLRYSEIGKGYIDIPHPASSLEASFLIDWVEQDPERVISYYKNQQSKLYDLVMGACLQFQSHSVINLLGDILVSPVNSDLVMTKRYFSLDINKEERDKDSLLSKKIGEFFRNLFDHNQHGWIDVIPYNENLIFLKGEDVSYDFVLRNMRATGFNHQIYAPYLRRSEIPSAMSDTYNFQRWLYFKYNGWKEMDEHLAQQYFYDLGGTTETYPGMGKVAESYLTSKKHYQPMKKVLKASSSHDLIFHKVDTLEKRLMVSNLITIEEFISFCEKVPSYFEWRKSIKSANKPDALESMNTDAPHLPASVTWYDACAYIKWLEDMHGLPIRLLKTDEYLSIRKTEKREPEIKLEFVDPLSNEDPFKQTALFLERVRIQRQKKCKSKLITFIDSNGNDLGLHPSYMDENEFQALNCVYVREPEYITHETGLKFVESDDFGEWLFENPEGNAACCIRSLSLSAVNGGSCVHRNTQPAFSTGKYKHTKVGFRVCYEVI